MHYGVLEEKGRGKWTENLFEEIQLTASLIWGRKQTTKSKKHRESQEDKPKVDPHQDITINMSKVKDRISKETRENN